jgi:hypothetical protein
MRPYSEDRTPPPRDAPPAEHAAFLRDELARMTFAPQIVEWLARRLNSCRRPR